MPFVLPIIVFGIAIVFIPTLGIIFLRLAEATGDQFHAPVPHSMAVIILALVVSLAIAGTAAFVASRPETPVPPRDDSHH
jgi:hypothetical protein